MPKNKRRIFSFECLKCFVDNILSSSDDTLDKKSLFCIHKNYSIVVVDIRPIYINEPYLTLFVPSQH